MELAQIHESSTPMQPTGYPVQQAYHSVPRHPGSYSYPHSYQMFIPATVTSTKRKPESSSPEEPVSKRQRTENGALPVTLGEDGSGLSDSESGSDNPKNLDYFLADSLLQQKFDPAELYPMMGETESDNDSEEYRTRRRQRRLMALLKLYKMQFWRLRDVLETKQRKFLKMQAEHMQKYSKFITAKQKKGKNSPTDVARLQAQQQVNQNYSNYHDIKLARANILASPFDEYAQPIYRPPTNPAPTTTPIPTPTPITNSSIGTVYGAP